jgi:hypothetical protein
MRRWQKGRGFLSPVGGDDKKREKGKRRDERSEDHKLHKKNEATPQTSRDRRDELESRPFWRLRFTI